MMLHVSNLNIYNMKYLSAKKIPNSYSSTPSTAILQSVQEVS
jgi:hypothetical protein